MEIELSVSGDGPAEALRSLEGWLSDRDELRGRTRLIVATPGPGEMGALPDALTIALGPGGVATAMVTALASVLISWIRRQRGKVSVTAKRVDGAEITLNAEHVRGLNVEQIPPLVTELAAALDRSLGPGLGDGGDEARRGNGTEG